MKAPLKKNQLMALALLLALLSSMTAMQAQTVPPLPKMTYLNVCEKPGVCKSISRLILGTDHLGKVPNSQTLEVLNEAVRLGINTFDTSPIYTDGIENRLGTWLRAQHRSDLHVITKGGFPHDLGPGTYQSRLKGTQAQIVANVLEEVNVSKPNYDSKIDIYLMHRDDADFVNYQRVARPQTPVADILAALSDPVLKSNYVMIGLSNWETPRVNESQRVAKSHPEWLRPVCNSPYFSLLEMGPVTIHSGGVQVKHAEMMTPAFQPGVQMMTYSPLGGFSIFSKSWEAARQTALDLKNNKDRYWGHVFDAIFHEANHQRYLRAQAFTRQFNTRHHSQYTLDQIVDAYALAHPRSNFLIIGPRTVEQLRRTVQILEIAKMLSPADLDYLYRNP